MIRPTSSQPLATVLLLVGSLSACAPTLPSLLAERHYGEAICAADEATTYDLATDTLHRDVAIGVAQIIVRDLDPVVHLHPLSQSELATLVGPEHAAAILADHVIVRTVLDTNRIPFGEFSFGPMLATEGESLATKPWRRATIIALTGETLPGTRTVEPGAIANAIHDVESALHGAREVGTALLDVPTLGLFSRLFPVGSAPREPTAQVFEPTDKEIVCAAPQALALEQALMSDAYCEPGSPCTDWTVWPREGTGAAALSFLFSFEQQAALGRGDCRTWTEVAFALPPGKSLEERIAAAFPSPRMRPLAVVMPPTH